MHDVCVCIHVSGCAVCSVDVDVRVQQRLHEFVPRHSHVLLYSITRHVVCLRLPLANHKWSFCLLPTVYSVYSLCSLTHTRTVQSDGLCVYMLQNCIGNWSVLGPSPLMEQHKL